MLESKHYYLDLINSHKANQFTSCYHYSGVGFKGAKINQGIYRKSDNLLVGILQWGWSAQQSIRLDRYVKDDISKKEYLELNRFCMADSEGKNSESEAIGLGIKWIKKNRPDIRLLVSYAGRKEGNYGYIYQATDWEYLGYFISSSFWLVDGEERHQTTLYGRWKRNGEDTKSFIEGLKLMYGDVRQTWSKQFIYIKRLDKTLTLASPLLPYPKPTNEHPIKTKEVVYQEKPYKYEDKRNYVYIYYEKDNMLFSRDWDNIQKRKCVGIYNRNGELESVQKDFTAATNYVELSAQTIRKAVVDGNIRKEMFFRAYEAGTAIPEEIELNWLCEIDGTKFFKQVELVEYCGVTKQAVSDCFKRKGKTLGGKEIVWKTT